MLPSAFAGSRRRVLIVDDHPDSAEVSCLLLSTLGYQCCPATSGAQAIAQAEQFHPDVVICDIGLPDISGYEVARALRVRHGAQLYLAALSGWDQPGDRARSVEAGFDQYLVKPANLTTLRAVMTASFRTGELPMFS
jgi:DNA-binding response OmpR family regulator